MLMLLPQPILPLPSPAVSTSPFIYVCISIPSQQIGASSVGTVSYFSLSPQDLTRHMARSEFSVILKYE